MTPADDTRHKLIEGAVRTLAEDGMAGASARTIGSRAGVNPALIYYHFGGLAALLAEASRTVAAERAAVYRRRLAGAGSLTELAAVARSLHEEEHRSGNLAMLSQLLAGSRTYPELAPVLDANFSLLADEVAAAMGRILGGTLLEDVLDARQLARAVSAGFVGIELLDTVSGRDDPDLLDVLERLAALVDVVLGAGTISSAVLRRRLRTTGTGPPS